MTKDTQGSVAVEAEGWLRALFAAFEVDRARYVALRADESLFVAGCELDLLVHPRSFATVLARIRRVSAEFDLRIAQWIEFPGHAANIILVWRADGHWNHYSLDIRSGIHKQGHLILDGRRLNGRMVVWDGTLGLRRLRDDLECALLAIRNAVDHRDTEARHLRIFAERGARVDIPAAAQTFGWELSGSVASGWSARASRRPITALPRAISMALYAVRAVLGRVRRRAFGMNIVIYGPDGVGKSTQAELLADFLKSAGVRNVHLYHHLVEVARLSERTSTRTHGAKVRAYRSAPRGWLVYGIVLASYLKKLGYVLRHVHPRLRRGHVFVHDRYLLDVFQKLQRSRNVRVQLLERILPLVSPQEPFVFVLRAPPDVIAGRTSELTSDQVSNAYGMLVAALTAGNRRREAWTDIDASAPVEQVHAAVLTEVLEIQDDRVRRRLDNHA